MRARPVRRNIYLPVVRFGVADSDWFTVLLISCAGYLAPVPFGITVMYVPLQMWTWLWATAGSIAFFNYIRIGRKPRWLPHKLRALLWHHRQYRTVPNGSKRNVDRSWILNSDHTSNESPQPDETNSPRPTVLLIEHNRLFQE